MGKKRAPLVKRDGSDRVAERTQFVAEGKCQFGEGEVQDVLVTELDAYGCRLRSSAVGVTKTESLQLWLGEVGPVLGQLRWARRGSVGIAFDQPLDEDSLARVCAIEPGPTVVPMRRRLGG